MEVETGVKSLRLLWVLTALAVGSASPPAEDETYERGRTLYLEHYCGACHRLDTVGTQGFFGPPHDAMGPVAEARVEDPSYRGEAVDAAGYLRESIARPAAYVVPGYAGTPHAMPAYALSEEDLDALVAFLLAQDGS